jgi:hypothetical protein
MASPLTKLNELSALCDQAIELARGDGLRKATVGAASGKYITKLIPRGSLASREAAYVTNVLKGNQDPSNGFIGYSKKNFLIKKKRLPLN